MSEFAREPILLEGETLATSSRHRPLPAVEAALRRSTPARETPSIEWRRELSLLLGLERLLDEEPSDARRRRRARPPPGRRALRHARRAVAELERRGANGRSNGARTRAPARRRTARRHGAGRDRGRLDEQRGDEDALAEEDELLAPRRGAAGLGGAGDEDEDVIDEAPEDPGASRRFWFEHATGAGKTVAAVGFVDASRTGGVLILTHRRNLVDQFIGEISDRGYGDRLSPPLLDGNDHPYGPVTVETYQWFVRNAGRISDAYSIVICDEAHTALGEKTSACIRNWPEPGLHRHDRTGALIARHVADLFPTQTSRFDLAQAARRGVIAPLRCIRIPPGPGCADDRQGAAATGRGRPGLRPGGAGQAAGPGAVQRRDRRPLPLALPQGPRSRLHRRRQAREQRRRSIPRRPGSTRRRSRARRRSASWPRSSPAFERGEVDVLCNAMLLAEGWNSPRATICMHLAPTASRRVYQQRVGRVTRRAPGKEAGLVIDFVHPATTARRDHRHPAQPLEPRRLPRWRDRRRAGSPRTRPDGSGRAAGVPVSADPERRLAVLERELWRIAVENLNYSEQHVWAALAGARVRPDNWRRARAMLQHDQGKELRRRFLSPACSATATTSSVSRRLSEVAALGDPELSTTRWRWSPPGRATSGAPARSCCCRRWSNGGSAAATRRGLDLAAGGRHPRRCTRNTRCSAGPRRSACWACS